MWSDRMCRFETPSKPSSSSISLAAILVAALGVEVSDLLNSPAFGPYAFVFPLEYKSLVNDHTLC